MTDQDLERALRAWYRTEVHESERAPIGLRTRLTSLPETHPIADRRPSIGNWRSLVMNRLVPIGVGAAAVVVAMVVGVFVLSRPPSNIGGPSPVPSPTLTSAPPAAGWRLVQELDPPPSTDIGSATATDAGFVAVGTEEELLQTDCFGTYREGVVLSSTDGEQWARVENDVFAYSQLDHVVDAGDELYILGRVVPIEVGFEESPGACGTPPPHVGFNVWRSVDNGASWERLAQSTSMQDAFVRDVIAVDGALVAVGVTDPESAESVSSAWTSSDGIEWRFADTPPRTGHSLVRSESVIVAAGNQEGSPLAYSEDAGRNWQQATVELGPALLNWGVAARDGRFVALFGPEETGDNELSVLISDDGKIWTEAPSLQLGSSVISGLVALPDRFLAIGSEWAPEADGRRFVRTRAWVSVDGIEWLPAPALTGRSPIVNAVAAGARGVVVSMWAPDELWFAPLSTFE